MKLKLVLSVLCVIIMGSACNPEGKTRPNIVFILADDLGYSDLGCYGAEFLRTPNIDQMAENGIRFTNFYNTGRCWPTRTSLMSGYYPHQILADPVDGVDYQQGNYSRVNDSWLPHLLKDHGYRCYHSGKWHLVRKKPSTHHYSMQEVGFDRSYRTEDGKHLNPTRLMEDDQPIPVPGPGSDYEASTAIVDRGITYLKEHTGNFPGKPFFQCLAFITPHFPLQAHQEDIDPYRGVFSVGWNRVREMRLHNREEMGFPVHSLAGFEPDRFAPWNLTQEELTSQIDLNDVSRAVPWKDLTDGQKEFQALKMAIHAAMITRMDREIGRYFEELEKLGLLENTIIFFCSDNGASTEIMNRAHKHTPGAVPGAEDSYVCLGPGWSTACNTPFRLHKTWVHEGGIATPLVVHWPAVIKDGGAFRTMPSHIVDIAPTLLELAGGSREEIAGKAEPPGISLVPVLKKGSVIERPPIFFHHENKKALRHGDWKITTIDEGASWELYNLAVDRGETNNLAVSEPGKLEELVRLWEEQRDQIVDQITDSVKLFNGNY
ncbi:MAG: sulfatase-like hydrolase/transferase [Bacteroidota bacterium]